MNDEYMQVNVEFEVDKDFDSKKFLKLKLRLIHDGDTAHNLNFKLDALKNAKNSLFNSPILANVIFDDNNQPQFSTHDKHIEKDYAGKVRIIYDEIPIGIIPENSCYDIKKEFGKNYVYADAYVWKKYSNYAYDIINRDKNIKLSAEIHILDSEIDKETKRKVIKKFKYDGITLLGNHRNPGMKNAQASVEFDGYNVDKKDYMIALMDELKECIHDYNNEHSMEGGKEVVTEEKQVTDTQINDNEPRDDDSTNFDKDNEANKPVKVIEDEEFELTTNETRRLISSELDALRRLIKTSTNESVYMWLNDFDSKYVYYKKEIYIDGSYKTTSFRRTYSIIDGKAALGDDETETVEKILTVEEWNQLEAEREAHSIEFDELKSFKQNTIKEQRKTQLDAIFDKFDGSLKDIEEYISLKDDNAEFDIQTIEEKCFALVGKLKLECQAEFDEIDENQVDVVVTGTDTSFDDDESNDYLGGYLNKYYKNKK